MQGCTTTVTSEVKSISSHGVHTFRKLYTFHCGVLDHHKNWPDDTCTGQKYIFSFPNSATESFFVTDGSKEPK